MSDMVERVARALAGETEEQWARRSEETSTAYRNDMSIAYEIKGKDWFRYQARTAITAMREPTAEMLRAGTENGWADHNAETITYYWAEMIDAALC